MNTVKDPLPLKHLPGEVQLLLGISDPKDITTQGGLRFVKEGQIVPIKPTQELSLEVGDLDILGSDLVLKDRIEGGSLGVVHRAEWHGSNVIVKILMNQDFHLERLKEFFKVTILKHFRHSKIVLFIDAREALEKDVG